MAVGVGTKTIDRMAAKGQLRHRSRPRVWMAPVTVFHPEDVAKLKTLRTPPPPLVRLRTGGPGAGMSVRDAQMIERGEKPPSKPSKSAETSPEVGQPVKQESDRKAAHACKLCGHSGELPEPDDISLEIGMKLLGTDIDVITPIPSQIVESWNNLRTGTMENLPIEEAILKFAVSTHLKASRDDLLTRFHDLHVYEILLRRRMAEGQSRKPKPPK